MSKTINVYYGYSDDVSILLGSKTIADSSDSGSSGSDDHGGILYSGTGYTIYEDGYYVSTGKAYVRSEYPNVSVTFTKPYSSTSYTVTFTNENTNSGTINIYSKTTTGFTAQSPTGSLGYVYVTYEVTGYYDLTSPH